MKSLSTIILLAFLTNLGFAQETESKLNGFDQEIEELIERYQAVGLSVAIVKDTQMVYAEGFGYRDLAQKLFVDENTSFHVASITKAFTASLLGMLEARDSVSLQQKPSYYIPRLQFYNNEMDNLITIESLLSHKSGLGNMDGSLVFFAENNRLRSLEKLRYLKPNGKINDSWLYSNIGYTIAATVVEQVTQKSWEENIKERIFGPLSMNHSFTKIEEMEQTDNYSLAYGLSDGEIREVLFEEYRDYSPAGAIKSSTRDLANWTMTWLNEGGFNGEQILPEDYVYEATSIQNIRPGNRSKEAFLFGDGFGWRVQTLNGQYRVHHGGNTSGFSSVIVLYPFDKLGIIVLCNQQNSLLPYIVADIAANRMLDLPQMNINEYPLIVTDIYTDNEGADNKAFEEDLSMFCGKYFCKGYGTMEIVEKNNSLSVIYPAYTFRLEQKSSNTFQMKLNENISQVFDPTYFELGFQRDNTGGINALKINLASELVEFVKE